MKKVIVFGSFNVLHPGHLRLLRFARELGGYLIVAVLSDRIAGEAAHVQEDLRLEGLQSITWLDEVFIVDETIPAVVKKLRPDIVVKGKEHEQLSNPELKELEKYGGRLVFTSGETIFSSLDLVRREFKELNLHAISLPHEFLKRHQIKPSKLIELLNQFSKLKVCVIGDLIIDEYITCEPLGMSQEDPTIVVTPVDSTRFIGGAGIVAAHASGLGASVDFFSVAGNDSGRNYALETLAVAGVNARLLPDDSRPTTIKQRFRCKGKSLLRVSHLHQGAISIEMQDDILTAMESVITEADLLVFSDFNYGCLPQPLVDKIARLSKKAGVMMVADSQSSSQIGDISRFKGMDLLTPTEREARISTRNREDGLVVLAEQLRQQASARNVLLKLGEEGLLIHQGDNGIGGWPTDRVDAMNAHPKDVSGAGDSLLIAAAMTLACGGNIWEASFIGSLAAAVQVGRLGNTPLLNVELLRELT